jgi:hypothetical protein
MVLYKLLKNLEREFVKKSLMRESQKVFMLFLSKQDLSV